MALLGTGARAPSPGAATPLAVGDGPAMRVVAPTNSATVASTSTAPAETSLASRQATRSPAGDRGTPRQPPRHLLRVSVPAEAGRAAIPPVDHARRHQLVDVRDVRNDVGSGVDARVTHPRGIRERSETIVAYLRSKFDYLEVIVPTLAMSAGTMISLAGGCRLWSSGWVTARPDVQGRQPLPSSVRAKRQGAHHTFFSIPSATARCFGIPIVRY